MSDLTPTHLTSSASSAGVYRDNRVARSLRTCNAWRLRIGIAAVSVVACIAALAMDDTAGRRIWFHISTIGCEVGEAKGCLLIMAGDSAKLPPQSACETTSTRNPDGTWTITHSLRLGPIVSEELFDFVASHARSRWLPSQVPFGGRTACLIPKNTIAACASIGALPLLLGLHGARRRSLRRRNNRCVNCGYSLVGSPGPRCSECGLDISCGRQPR